MVGLGVGIGGFRDQGVEMVGLGVEMVGLEVGIGGFRDQGVETGRFKVCLTWSGAAQNDQSLTSKYHESDSKA